jgi:hypothetical protein
MSQIVLQRQCSRCPKTENTPIDLETYKPADPIPALNVYMGGALVAGFDFLCGSCRNTVLGYLEQVVKHLEKRGSTRTRKGRKVSS